jgi:GNAT superfamily N-acetyltransferase
MLLINNGTWLTAPVSNEGELRARIEVAIRDAQPHKLPWVLYLLESSLTGAEAVATELGLHRMGGLRVMTGDMAEFRPPVRPLPSAEFRRVMTAKGSDAWVALDLNTRAYGMPLEITQTVVDSGAYFSDPNKDFGFIAVADGIPVSTATVIELDGWLYVAAVATDPKYRQLGYAEAVMRHALQVASAELGICRTALDASLMGAPLYEQMGYQKTGETWGMYTPG